MKELIIDIMARYEAEIRKLSETQYAGPCFKTFIRKWEMLTDTSMAAAQEEKPPLPPQYAALDIRFL